MQRVVSEAIHESLRYRVTAKVPAKGWKLEVNDFLLSLTHFSGTYELTWGMWTLVLQQFAGRDGYVAAYPGYDFQFEIRKYQGWEIEGHIIGAGFVWTRKV